MNTYDFPNVNLASFKPAYVNSFINLVFPKIIKNIPDIKLLKIDYPFGGLLTMDFEIESLKGWIFRIFFTDIKNKKFRYLGEHYELIDKFKPGRVPIDEENLENFIKAINLVKENPKKVFVESQHFGGIENNKITNNILEDEIEKIYKEYWLEKRERQRADNKAYYYMLKEFPKMIFNKVKEVDYICLDESSYFGKYKPTFFVLDESANVDEICDKIDETIEEYNNNIPDGNISNYSNFCFREIDGYYCAIPDEQDFLFTFSRKDNKKRKSYDANIIQKIRQDTK